MTVFSFGLGVSPSISLGIALGENKVDGYKRAKKTVVKIRALNCILSGLLLPIVSVSISSLQLYLTGYNCCEPAELRAHKDFKYKELINGFSLMIVKVPLAFLLGSSF